MSEVTLTKEQYEALVFLARKGVVSVEAKHALDAFLRDIDRGNGIVRYTLRIRWQEAHKPLPPAVSFPREWPPVQESALERIDRPIAKVDVLEEVNKKASNPVGILVTKDVAGVVGWAKLDDFFTA